MSSFPPSYDGGTAMGSRPKRHCVTRLTTKRSTGTRARACMACESAHHKCTGVPCDRCFRLSLRCRPSPNLGAAANRTQPLLELLLERHDGHAMANLYMQQFGLALREGLVDRDMAVRLVRVWRARSILADADVTFGLAGCISEQLGVLPMEMEGKDSVGWEAPDHVRRIGVLAVAKRTFAAGEELKKSDLFKRFDDGVSSLCLSVLSPQGGFTLAANANFEAQFQKKAADMVRETDVRKLNSTFTAAAVMAPEDRGVFFRQMVRMLSTRSPKREVVILKLLDWKKQRPQLVIYTTWQETLPDGSLVVVQRLEPAPRSRHLNDVPQSMCVVKAFRASSPSVGVPREAAAGAAGAAAAEREVIEAAHGRMVIEKAKGKKDGREREEGNDRAAGGFCGMPSLACVFPLSAGSDPGGREMRTLPASATDIFKPVYLTEALTAPPMPCPDHYGSTSVSPSCHIPHSPSLFSSPSSVSSLSSSSSASPSFSSSASTATAGAAVLQPAACLQPKAKARSKDGTRNTGGDVATKKNEKKKGQEAAAAAAAAVGGAGAAGAAAATATPLATPSSAATTKATEMMMSIASDTTIGTVEEDISSMLAPLRSPLAPSAWELEEREEGREGGGEELLLGGNLEGLEDLDFILNDAVMSELF